MSKKYYEVEKIVGKKRLPNGKILYNIQWVGYSSKDNTWESIANLANVKSMIDEYEKANPENKNNLTWKVGSLKEDVPKFILGSKIIKGKLYMLIRWKKRRTNVQPENSWILYSELKEKYPYVVLEFFETNLTINEHQVEYNPDKSEFYSVTED